MTAAVLADLLGTQQLLAAALTEHPAQALARLAAWLDPISFVEDLDDTDDDLLRVLGICRSCFPDVYGEAAVALWNGTRDIEVLLCKGMSRHLVAPVNYLEDVMGGIPFEAYGINFDEWIADPDCRPILTQVAAWFDIPEHGTESAQPTASRLIASLEKRGETGTASDMATLLRWLFSCSGNTLVDHSAEDIWESGIETPYWDKDGIEFMNEVQQEAGEIMDAVERAVDLLETHPAWGKAIQANIRRVMERKESDGRLVLQWP